MLKVLCRYCIVQYLLLKWLRHTLTATLTCSSHSGTELFKTYTQLVRGIWMCHHHHYYHPSAVEQAITSFLQAHHSLARVAISSAAISFSSYPNTRWM